MSKRHAAVAAICLFLPFSISVAAQTSISILNYGADPTCHADSTAAINKATADAAAKHALVVIPPGCYAHGGYISAPGVALRGSGDQSELRATNILQPLMVSTWTIDGRGDFSLQISNNRYILPGSPIQVHGLVGYRGACNPNGDQVAISSNLNSVVFRPKNGTCRSGSGFSGFVVNTAPLAAIVMTGENTQIRNLRLTTTWTGGRASYGYSSAILNRATHFLIDHVHVVGSAAAGTECQGCSDGIESNNIVENTLADGMEHHSCSSNILNEHNKVVHSGDDSYSVNSYQHDPCLTHDIRFVDNVSINSHARGFETDSGTAIIFSGGTISHAATSCIFLHSGSSPKYKMGSLNNIEIEGVQVDGCGQAAVYIGSEATEFPAGNITISHLTATNIRGEALHLGLPAGDIHAVHVENSSFEAAQGSNHAGVYLAGAHDVVMNGVRFFGYGHRCLPAPGPFLNVGPIAGTSVACDGSEMRLPAQH